MSEETGSGEGDNGLERMLDDLFPYRRLMPTQRVIPEQGVDRDSVLTDIANMAKAEDAVGHGSTLKPRKPRQEEGEGESEREAGGKEGLARSPWPLKSLRIPRNLRGRGKQGLVAAQGAEALGS